jgi:hypothetical protein
MCGSSVLLGRLDSFQTVLIANQPFDTTSTLVGLKGQQVKKVSSNKDGGGCNCLIYQDGSVSVLVNSI